LSLMPINVHYSMKMSIDLSLWVGSIDLKMKWKISAEGQEE